MEGLLVMHWVQERALKFAGDRLLVPNPGYPSGCCAAALGNQVMVL